MIRYWTDIMVERLYNYYMIFDEQKVCLHNVFGQQVGTTLVNKRTVREREVIQQTNFSYDMKRILLNTHPSLKASIEVIENYKRTQPTIDTAYQSLKKFYPNTETNNIKLLENECFMKAAQQLQDQLKGMEIPIMKKDFMLENIFEILPEKSASAGLPYALSPQHKKLDVITYDYEYMKEEFLNLLDAAQDVGENMSYRAFTSPCIVYQKSAVVPKVDDEKVRLIWGYPLSMTMAEGMFALPVLQALKEREQQNENFFTAYTFGPYGDQHQRYVLQALPVVVRDFSAYDSTVPEPVIRVAFELLFDLFYFENEEEKLFYRNVYDMIIDYFIHTPILVGQTSTLFCKHHGIPSGSWFTSVIGSMANYLMTATAHIAQGVSFISMKCMGDDNICQYSTIPDVKLLNKYMSDTFGLNVNDKKTYCGKIDGAKFLGRHFRMPYDAATRDLWWYRPPSSTLIQMFFPHEFENINKCLIRLYSLYLDNPTWWMYYFLQQFEEQLEDAFQYQRFLDAQVQANVWKYTHADIERNRMIRLVTMLDDVDYWQLKPPDKLVFEIKSRQLVNMF